MKIHIEVEDDISPVLVMECVKQVIRDGRVSEGENGKKYYCWATSFNTPIGEVMVFTRQNRKSDCFLVKKRIVNP